VNVDTVPSEPLITGRQAIAIVATLAIAVAVLSTLAILLPHERYVRYQQFASGDAARLRWVYERIHFDPTPIDVAVVGSSRVEAAISAPNLSEALSKTLGHRVEAANLAVPLEGRDLHYLIGEDLLRSRPETRLVLMSLVEPIRRTHPAFRYVADVSDVLGAPLWINYYWLENAAFLPYRQLSFFVQTLFPSWFGVRLAFDRGHYLGTAFDTTHNFRLENGKLVDREAHGSRAALDAAPTRSSASDSVLARLTGGNDNIIEDTLTARLARDMEGKCSRLLLVHLPTYRGKLGEPDLATNSRAATVLRTPPWVGADWTDYYDSGHLRRSGIDQVSAWLPQALAPHLQTLRQPPVCRW